MECRNCGRELKGAHGFCPNCGEQIVAGLQVATKEPPGARDFIGLPEFSAAEAVETEGGLQIIAPEATSPQPQTDDGAKIDSPIHTSPGSRRRWSPRKDRVESWAIRKELNHYDVLDLNETATEDELNERITILDDTLERWSVDQMDAQTQILGTSGKNRIYELKSALANRADYNREVEGERHRQAVARVKAEILRFVEKDMVLQWNEWLSVEMKAREEGVSPEELEELLQEQRALGVLTGLSVGGREVRTLLALKDRCRGRGEQLIEPIWNGEMARWLRTAAEKSELADEVDQIKEQYVDAPISGATLLLWRIGEKRLVLSGNSGIEEVTGVRQFIDGFQNRGLEESAMAALKDRRLENWLREAMNQEVMADIAARERDEGRKGLLEIIRQAEAQRGESFEFENGQAYSVAELVELCDKFTDEAQGYLFDGILSSWLANRGYGPLARQANTIVQEYNAKKKRKFGLEMFVRKLCEKAGIDPYPRLVPLPSSITFNALPVGARASQTIRLENQGRGYFWGDIVVDPAPPGLNVTAKFDSNNLAIDVTVDTLEVPPGDYQATIIFNIEGVPAACQVPLRYQVIPLNVRFEPAAIELGKILHGKTESATLFIACQPENGRLVGKPSVDPEFNGVQINGYIDGIQSQLQVVVDTASYEPGRQYATDIHLDTNIGRFNIPLRFRTALRWDIVAGWTAGVSVATGLLLWVCRLILASADPAFSTWFLSYQRASSKVLVTGGILGAIIAGIIAIIIAVFVSKRKAAGLSRVGKT
jgi:hypothetical protein